MAEWSGGRIQCCLLLLLLLPTLLLAQDDCSNNCKSEANRYYFVRPEGSAETLCPAQPCLTPSQLREHFSECERNSSCQTANTSLVLLPGTYTSASNHGSIIPPLKFLSLTAYNEDCDTDSLATPSIDCNGTWISLVFQQIKCLHVQYCAVFTGNDTTVVVDHVTFHDSLIRLASITAGDHSELDYNNTLGSQTYCLLQKQLADINTLVPSNSRLGLRNVSFSSDYHTACAREYGIQLATIHATDSTLDITDCLFTQNALTHTSLLHSTLHTSGMVKFENGNTAIIVNNSTITLAGIVNFVNNNNSAIVALDTHSTILLAGTVEFTNNTANKGGAISMVGGNMIIAANAQALFQGNRAMTYGGAITSIHNVTIAGSVHFINNSADEGGAIDSEGNVTITNNAQVYFQNNHAKINGGAIISLQFVTIAGSVQFVNNSAKNGGAIASIHNAIIAGSVHFINNSADQGGAIISNGNVTIANNAQVVFQDNNADTGGAIASLQFVTIAGSVQFINNSANNGPGGAIASIHNVTIIIAGSVQFINNSAYQGGAINSNGNVTIINNAQVYFQNDHAKTNGGAIVSSQHVTIAGSVQFINNSAIQGGAIESGRGVTIANNAQVIFQGNHADRLGGAIAIDSNIVLAGSVQYISNTAELGGAISMFPGKMTVANNAKVVFQGNHAYHVGGAIYSSACTLVQYALKTEPCSISFGGNSTVDLLHNTAERGGSAIYGITMSKLECNSFADGDYEYLFDIITIIPESFSAISSDPLRVCICPDQSTPDCLAILPDQNIPHLRYTVYPGQTFTIPAVVVGFNFALTSGSVYAQFLSSDASLGSDTQYVQGVNQTGCSPLQYSVLSDKKQETLVVGEKLEILTTALKMTSESKTIIQFPCITISDSQT